MENTLIAAMWRMAYPCPHCGHSASMHAPHSPEVFQCQHPECECGESPAEIRDRLTSTDNSDSPDSGKGEGGAK
jgi:hypothetical protein